MVAAYQGPYLPFGSMDAVELIREQLTECERIGVDLLCCPEAILGGLAHESDGQIPHDVAVSVEELRRLLAPLTSSPVATVVGFTEHADDGQLHNSAAFLADGAVQLVYRKVYPGYRTVIRAGTELPVIAFRGTVVGIMICNDLWYVEPARILASKGAAVILVPTNSGHLRNAPLDNRLRTRSETLPVARAVDNTVSVVIADIAGRQHGRAALGSSRIVDPDGALLCAANPHEVGLVASTIDTHSRPFDPRGWDGHTNPAVHHQYASISRCSTTGQASLLPRSD
ncbi:carbon-nitrogen hydrolase family protein [Mycolicibacterium hodleri]|uniref:carbon-nitrogen hydrolase family protein n=1 Tax=Mycolicibacterium hodleri TaxID=49897 RepID=UPI0021F33F28|nr:carbon-nitrogen hydrolase family protein [Mycolicibacterium hodleri]